MERRIYQSGRPYFKPFLKKGDEMSKQMTPQERMGALFMGEKPDRVPVNPFVEGYTAQITGISMGDWYADGNKCFDAQFASMRLHGYEATPFYGYASCGPAEFGGKIEFPYKEGAGAPYILEHPVNSTEDVERLEVPDFKKALPGLYGQADIVAERSRALGMPATFQAGSAFTAASVVADTTIFLKWLVKEPKVVHLLMEKVSAMYINALEYFAAKYGPENCLPFDGGPTEANTVIAPEKFEEFVYPYNLKVHTRIKELGIPGVLMHPCADQNMNIPYYIKLREKLGWNGKYFWLFGPETPIADQIKAFGDHDVICGNVDPVAFQFKSYEECLQLCKENIEAGKDSPNGFILAPGCEFPALAPPVNLMALVDAAQMFGKYE
jgi:uroporphyrinogen decarboxylase